MVTRMVKVEETGNENEKPVGPRVLVSEIVMIDLPEGTSLYSSSSLTFAGLKNDPPRRTQTQDQICLSVELPQGCLKTN